MPGSPKQQQLAGDDSAGKRKPDDATIDIDNESSNAAKRIKDDSSAQANIKNIQPQKQQQQYLREADVGITEFVTPGWGGFDAIIKHRFSDFFVNEIDRAGRVEHLTSYTDAVDPEPPATEEEKEIEQLGVPDDPQEAFEQGIARLEGILGKADSARIRAHLEITERQTLEERSLLIDHELSKDERKQVYFVTNNFIPVRLTCETVEGKLKFIRRNINTESDKEAEDSRSKQNKKQQQQQARRRGRGSQWRHIGDYCHFVMQKENHDTMDVLNQIARHLRISSRSLGVAGTKDKRGITVQRCSAYRVDHGRLIWASKKLRGARLGNYSYAASELKLGDLGGNQFRIILRHVEGADAESLAPVLEGIRATGFINYYGMQRFGTQSISSHAVGVAVLKADWQGAVDLILKPRPGDRKEVRDARDTWYQTNDASAALKLLPQRAALAEYSILQAFAKNGGASNAASAFAAIPRNLRLMYVHAYQSYIWNSAVSERIRLYGVDKVVPGDLVIKAHELSTADSDESEASEGPEEVCRAVPTLVTKDNISEYSIYDVVLPLPGWAIKYPEHEVKGVYVENMEKDGLSASGLDRHPLKEYKLAGAYRHMVIKPRVFSHEWMRYNDDMQPLARSDSDAIEGKHEPESIDFGQHVALKLAFDLPSSAYATMLLRELMRQETAAGHQTKLSSKTGLRVIPSDSCLGCQQT
ncbi:multisubstrate pseudouridine synthase 7 [Coemansia sp. RSA 1813]|nr:multisubstrate pseudouridine synthase 7 [Coemansia sp. RSA 1646]KAJ2214349.1 multisubstrate pseudouridine synthase 7 [Coemansia sp. RSA 487]KAJ2568916.1 multisubstrate pseudouridine synthase 7 [Coemansia sp. RSA 1813]